ncbi:MAG TPA: DUF3631 domain-containing protein [Candidatus Angelobacter sp.]
MQAAKPAAASKPVTAPIDSAQLLSDIIEFIDRYLHCSLHQRTVLGLWVFHTHSIGAAATTPYLAIRSDHKQSGKTLCLHLLSLLCHDPAFSSGFTASTLTRRIDPVPHTLLLDEFQATIGTRVRSKNPALRALLVSGSRFGPGYTHATHERNLFCPKAFAGTGTLPEMLADRSIPILLEPLTTADKVQRFNPARVFKQSRPLCCRLHRWTEKYSAALEELPALTAEQFPSGLSPRRQDMIEPLLQVAGFIGGEWPQRAREALSALFEQEVVHGRKDSLQLLCDIREAFNHHGNPERISTAALLDWLHTQPGRPWNQDGPITAQTLAAMLQSFGIRSRTQRIGKASPARGYLMQDFVACWFKLLPPESRFNNDGSVRQPITKLNENAPCSNVAAGGEVPTAKGNGAALASEKEREIRWGLGSLSTVQQIPGSRTGPVMAKG